MNKTLTTLLKYVVFLGLGVWITWHMFSELTPAQRSELLEAIQSINYWYLIPVFIVGALSHYVRAIRWRYLLETINLRPDITNTFFAVMIGYITNLALPRAGEVAKCTVLARYEKMPAHKMVGTIVAERTFDLFCLLLIAIVTFFIEIHRINGFVGSKFAKLQERVHTNREELLIMLGIAVAAFMIVLLLYRRYRKSKAGKLLEEMAIGIFSIFKMKKKWQFLGQTILMWLLYTLQVYIGLKCLHGTGDLPVMASLVVLVYGSVGLILTPGGIGAYPYLVAQILGAYPVSEIAGQAFGWIAWAVQTLLVLILGVAALLLIHPYNKKRNGQTTVGNS
jgi:glycosyltransferase 2 family protein